MWGVMRHHGKFHLLYSFRRRTVDVVCFLFRRTPIAFRFCRILVLLPSPALLPHQLALLHPPNCSDMSQITHPTIKGTLTALVPASEPQLQLG